MTGANRLGLEMLTLLGMPPVEYVHLAGELGCGFVSSGLTGLPLAMFGIADCVLYPAWSLRENPGLRRETIAALRGSGLVIGLGEGYRAAAGLDVGSFAADLDIHAELGTVRINAIGLDPDLPRCQDQLAKLAAMAGERGMDFTIEFCPGMAIDTLDKAVTLIGHIGQGHCRVLIDAMHFLRTGGTVAQVAALDADLIGYVQLADGPAELPDESYMHDAMFARGVPGEGALPLRALIAALPPAVPISLEVPRLDDLRLLGPREHGRRVVAAARALGV